MQLSGNVRKFLFVAAWTEDYSPRFLPLVQEVKAHYPESVLSAIFYKEEIPGTSQEAEVFSELSLFDSIVIAKGLQSFREHIQSIDGATEVFVFVRHSWLLGDDAVFKEINSNVPKAIFLLRNVIALQTFFASGEDQKRHIQALLRKNRRRDFEIHVKVFLVTILVHFTLLFLKLFARYRPRHQQHKILFMRLDVLGDMVLSLPALLALRQAYPNSELTVMASRRSGIIIEEQQRLQPGKFCDRLLFWQASWHLNKERLQQASAFLVLFREAIHCYLDAYDLIVQPVELGTGIAFAALMRGGQTVAPIAERLPLARSMANLVDGVRIAPHTIYHIADLPNWCAEAAGAKDVARYQYKVLDVDKDEQAGLMSALAQNGYHSSLKIIAVNIGAGSLKRVWSVENYASLLNNLKRRPDCFPLVIGGPGEKKLWQCILPGIEGQVASFVGATSLNQLIALLDAVELVVTPDTGVMHLAAALDKKIVALFGAGLVPFCKPLCTHYRIVKQELGCSGCGDVCFQDGESPCIAQIRMNMVIQAINELY